MTAEVLRDDGSRVPASPSYSPGIQFVFLPEDQPQATPDEFCLTFCLQNSSGRANMRFPRCRSLCLRRVFAREVRNVLNFQGRTDTQTECTSKLPLPPEGQAREPNGFLYNLADGTLRPGLQRDTKADERYWEEGYYLWSSSNVHCLREHFYNMSHDLPTQVQKSTEFEATKRAWKEYERKGSKDMVLVPAVCDPGVDERMFSSLWRVSPSSRLQRAVTSYLAPTRTLVGVLRRSVEDGTQQRFARRVWEKAWTPEPLNLISAVYSKMSELWNVDPSDETG